jgi:DNA-binding LytR/AlgR family response regulator
MTTAQPTAVLADDEPHLARALAQELATLWPELQVLHVARNGIEAAERINALRPSVAFLDIQMPGLTGLEVAQGIEPPTQLVFVTAFDRYAVEAFDAEAIDYVLKPISSERLARTVQRLQKKLADEAAASEHNSSDNSSDNSDDNSAALLRTLQRLLPPGPATPAGTPAATPASTPAVTPLRWVRASVGELVHQIAVHDVLFFHADDKYTCVQTASSEYLIRTPIAELAAQLDPLQFVQVHRSTLINLQHMVGTRRDAASRLFVRMAAAGSAAGAGAAAAAKELPVSRAYVHLFKAM